MLNNVRRMNLGLQRSKTIEVFKKRVPDTDWEKLIDESVFDSSLHLTENLERLAKQHGIQLDDVTREEIIETERQGREIYEQDIIAQIKDKPILSFKETHEEICKFTHKGEDYVYSTIFCLMENDFFINKGICGCGKSRSSVELIEYLNSDGYALPRTIVKSGYITPKKFFKLLKEYSDCKIVFDEADILMDSKQISRMMKSLFTSRKVIWETEREEDECVFKGSILMNCNDFQNDKGVIDKVHLTQKSLFTDDFKESYSIVFDGKPNREIWNKIKDRVVYARGSQTSLSDKERELVKSYVMNVPYIGSYRFITRSEKIFLSLKKLYGCLNKEIFEYGKHLCSLQINKKDDCLQVLESMGQDIDSKELVEKIGNFCGCSTRSAQRKINELVEFGYLERLNKFKLKKLL